MTGSTKLLGQFGRITTLLLAVLMLAVLLPATGCWKATSTSWTSYDQYDGGELTVTSTTNDWVYYPAPRVYYSSHSGKWCFHDGRVWHETQNLPEWYRSRLGNYVTISYRGKTPYNDHAMHARTFQPYYHRRYHADHRRYDHGTTRSYAESRARSQHAYAGYYATRGRRDGLAAAGE